MNDVGTQITEAPVRSEERLPLFSGGQPFLGFSEDWKRPFLYRPCDISPRGASFKSHTVSEWTPQAGEHLNLCLPFHLGSEYLDACEVRWVRQEEGHWICGGRLTHRTPLRYPIYLESVQGIPLLNGKQFGNEDAIAAISFLLEETWFAKRAILIYFRHLAPMFSRTSKHGLRGHARMSARFYDSVELRIQRSIRAIETLRKSMAPGGMPARVACKNPGFIELLRGASVSEIEFEPLERSFAAHVVNRYLHSIRVCEHKLAINYNTVLLIHYWLV